MVVGERNATNVLIALPNDVDGGRHLDEIDGLQEQKLPRNATGPAARLSNEVELVRVLQQRVVRLLNLLRRPGLQDRVLGIDDRNEQRDEYTRTVLDLAIIGIGRVELHGAVARA